MINRAAYTRFPLSEFLTIFLPSFENISKRSIRKDLSYIPDMRGQNHSDVVCGQYYHEPEQFQRFIVNTPNIFLFFNIPTLTPTCQIIAGDVHKSQLKFRNLSFNLHGGIRQCLYNDKWLSHERQIVRGFVIEIY
uniref:Uncharacterized protein n=1 Tax=Glossina pallidipes TaxID=7398 RepID=A0A1A9ZBG2_GLOPL